MTTVVQLDRGVILINISEENVQEAFNGRCDEDDAVKLEGLKDNNLEPIELKDEVVLDSDFTDESTYKLEVVEEEVETYWEPIEEEDMLDEYEDEEDKISCWESQLIENDKEQERIAFTNKREHACSYCEFTTSNGHGHLLYHMKHSHSYVSGVSEEFFQCDQCSYKAKQRVHLKCHVESAHLGIDYSCDLCDFKTKWKNRLKTHKKSIHKEGGYPCPFCSYNAGERYVLSQHIKAVHENNKRNDRYSCEYCDYKAGQKSHVKAHIQAIHENNLFICDLCGFQTKWKNRLKSHTNAKHKGVFVYCDHCDFKTCEKFQLKKHIESKHGDIKFTCMACGHKVMSLLELKKHMEDVHADPLETFPDPLE
eukprot:GFUD01044628.1.p1 GENE.GFUD01044628.1~~GFUD01044628.1.p1  ORF type:complete len:366 (+),score=59.07 GFUD01044628.1:43-1140(+)